MYLGLLALDSQLVSLVLMLELVVVSGLLVEKELNTVQLLGQHLQFLVVLV